MVVITVQLAVQTPLYAQQDLTVRIKLLVQLLVPPGTTAQVEFHSQLNVPMNVIALMGQLYRCLAHVECLLRQIKTLRHVRALQLRVTSAQLVPIQIHQHQQTALFVPQAMSALAAQAPPLHRMQVLRAAFSAGLAITANLVALSQPLVQQEHISQGLVLVH